MIGKDSYRAGRPAMYRGPIRYEPESFVPFYDAELRFTGLPLNLDYIDGLRWRLARDASYCIQGGELAGRVSTMRAGFIFDFASIPRFFWRIATPAGNGRDRYGLGAAWHDWLYRYGAVNGHPINRAQADAVFLEIMQYVNVRPWLAATMYRAVRIGGAGAWASRAASHNWIIETGGPS